ncbi:MAG: A24 family peptidase [Planctomycetota bacterium]|jgi:prepilin peptidase CpaA
MWATTLFDSAPALVQWGVVITAAVIALATDLRSRRIPNWLTGPLLAGGLVFAGLVGGLPGLADSFTACLLLAFPFVLLFLFARGGAGDAKLMGALGAWLGLVNGLALLLAVAACGIVLAIAWSLWRREAVQVANNLGGIATGVFLAVCTRTRVGDAFRASADPSRMQVMPYGVAIFAGVCLAAVGVLIWHG